MVDEAGQDTAAGEAGVLPDVFVDAQGGDALQALGVGQFELRQRLDVVPDRMPVDAELPGDRRDRDVLFLQLLVRPVAGAHGELFPWPDAVVFLGEGDHGALLFVAAEHALVPVQDHGRALGGNVVDGHRAPGVGPGLGAASAAPCNAVRGFDDHDEPGLVASVHRDHVQSLEVQEGVCEVAPRSGAAGAGHRIRGGVRARWFFGFPRCCGQHAGRARMVHCQGFLAVFLVDNHSRRP